MEKEFILCECNSLEHQITFFYMDGDYPEISVNIHLVDAKWYKRIWKGIKYIFGYKCRFGHFDEVLISYRDADKFQKIADYLKLIKNKVND